jgi:hypothetical protein
MNGRLRRRLAGSALGGLVAFTFVPAATAQWLPPWRTLFPGEVERSLEAQGYVLTAPLVRRPGIYLADVSAGPAKRQRLVIDAGSGQILERFAASGRWEPALAARRDTFGGPPPRPAPAAKSAYGGPAKPSSTERKPPAIKGPTVNPPLPPPAPREAAKSDGSGSPTSEPAKKPSSDQPRIDPRPTEVDNVPPATAPAAPALSPEASDKAKVNVVPPALFE